MSSSSLQRTFARFSVFVYFYLPHFVVLYFALLNIHKTAKLDLSKKDFMDAWIDSLGVDLEHVMHPFQWFQALEFPSPTCPTSSFLNPQIGLCYMTSAPTPRVQLCRVLQHAAKGVPDATMFSSGCPTADRLSTS